MSVFEELKRRNVLRVAAAYLVVAWLVIQVVETIFPAFGFSEFVVRITTIVFAVGFVPVLVFAWAFELTPEGLKREKDVDRSISITPRTGRRLDRMIMAGLALALGYFAFDKFVLEPHRQATLERQTAAELAQAREEALQEGRGESLQTPINDKSIAVLPFLDMSQAKDQEYFSDGISEELLNLLAKVPGLLVSARTSSFSFKGKEVEIPEIGRQLHVAHVLEGSVRKAGDTVRITAQLIRAADGFHLWSETYDRKLDDIFKIQDEIAGDVVKELKVQLLSAAPRARETDPRAYALYLQAVQLGRQLTAEAFKQSDALYRQVLEIDPTYAPAWDGLASNYTNETGLGLLAAADGYTRARTAEEKAVALDPGYAPARAGLGWIALYGDNDLAGAARHLEGALAIDPTDPQVLGTAAAVLQALGRLNEALVIYQAIVRRDPVNVPLLHNLAYYQRWAGNYASAIKMFRTVLSLSPGRGGTRFQLGVAKLFMGDATGALAQIEQEKSEMWRMIGLPMAYDALGRKADADKAMNDLIGKWDKHAAYNVAYVYGFRGEADQAFDWLHKAVAYQDTGLNEIVNENLFDNIHADPRWLPFLRTLGKAPDQLAKIKFRVSLPQAWQHEAPSRDAQP